MEKKKHKTKKEMKRSRIDGTLNLRFSRRTVIISDVAVPSSPLKARLLLFFSHCSPLRQVIGRALSSRATCSESRRVSSTVRAYASCSRISPTVEEFEPASARLGVLRPKQPTRCPALTAERRPGRVPLTSWPSLCRSLTTHRGGPKH